MTDETKKLFQAPWTVDGGLIRDCYDRMLFSTRVGRNMDTKRMSHMPELYDALMVAAYEHCRVCLYGHVKDARHMPKPDDMARNGCTLSDFPHCPNRNWWNLLKKVSDGE